MTFISSVTIKSWYFESKNIIYDARKFIMFAFFMFCLGIILGYFYLSDSQLIKDGVTELLESFHTTSYFIFVSKIFIHNVIIAYLSIRLGILLGLIPTISSLASGISVGWAFANFNNIHYIKLLLLLVPHGVFELPAMFLAWGIGFWHCKIFFIPNYDQTPKENVKRIHKLFIRLILPLLAIAAIIEGRSLLF
jgi:stage II sporulation protein M